MKIVKTTSVKSDGTDILYSGIILDETSKDKAIEICNDYINSIPMKKNLPDAQAYDLMHCTTRFIGCDICELNDANIDTMHSDTTCYVDKIGIYYTRENGELIPQNIGLHVNIHTASISHKYFTKGETSHITVALCSSKASAKNTNKCFQNIDNEIEFSTCVDIDPVLMSGKFEFVNTKHVVIDEFTKEFFECISCINELDGLTEDQLYELDSSILRKFGADDSTILILKRASLDKVSDVTWYLDSNPKKIKSLRGIASKRYASLVTAVNNLLGTSYSTNF